MPETEIETAQIVTAETYTIHEALCAVIVDLPAIGKESKMSGGGGYKYRGVEDILPSIKILFGRHSIHCAPNFTVVSDESGQGNKGNQRRVVIQGAFRFYASDGSYVTSTTIGEAMDVQDKAMNKAMTAAYKYALVQTLAIADGDDPDAYQPNTAAPAEPAPEPSTSFLELKSLGFALKEAGVADQVKDWAKSQEIEMTPTADLSAVVEVAKGLLAGTEDNV